ncbi:MAG: DUF499 domain-containing protein [Deltaproteobacteria bacterium]|nr:DUF499 domain-containing protein [Deltaproteobacteria bacterium]
MLGLKLRKEFLDKRLSGTQIELTTTRKTGATEIPAADFLEITYPSNDVLAALEGVGPDRGRAVVLLGDRGQGKSHLIAVLHHALKDQRATRRWLQGWAPRLGNPKVAQIPLRDGMVVISEGLQRQRHKFLWDVLFEGHPDGNYVRGRWDAMGAAKTNIPGEDLILELLNKHPTAFILDEFQTWFDGLTETKKEPHRSWAFNFIQILSGIARRHPDLLVLVVSVRNGNTDAFQQIQRDNPVLIDFKGPNARKDRMRLLLHRLFQNRANVPPEQVEAALGAHVAEYLRLRGVPASDHQRERGEFTEAWPFAPHLLQLLEDQVLDAVAAQETRDLIKILASLYKRSGERAPVITAADFNLEDEDSGIEALISSVSMPHLANLRAKALRNLEAVREAVRDHANALPHLGEVVGALWLRSLAAGNLAGADATTLHIDITRDRPIDDNAFQVELDEIVNNSFNIHRVGPRLVFREEENPEARLKALARNDRLFADGSDLRHLAKEIRYVIGGADDVPRGVRVIVLGSRWGNDPWADVEETERPERWDDRAPLIVLPADPGGAARGGALGRWLKERLTVRRNTVRFLLPKAEADIYTDRALVLLARMVLKATEWQRDGSEYRPLVTRFQNELRTQLKGRFDRFAVLREWDYEDPSRCAFDVESHQAEGSKIPDEVERRIREDLFALEDFEALVLQLAATNGSVGKLLAELQEPRPNGAQCIPWLGETQLKERLLRLCAKGKVAVNVRGERLLQTQPDETEDAAFQRLKNSSMGTGKALHETTLSFPRPTTASDGIVPPDPTPAAPTSTDQTLQNLQPTAVAPLSGGGTGSTVEAPAPLPPLVFTAPQNSALNLLNKVEGWGVKPTTALRSATIKVSGLTGEQLNKLLKGLPDGLKFELTVEKG